MRIGDDNFVSVISYLPMRDKAKCAEVCKLWRQIIRTKSSAIWKPLPPSHDLKIQLYEDTWFIYCQAKKKGPIPSPYEALVGIHKWGYGHREPFVCTRIFSTTIDNRGRPEVHNWHRKSASMPPLPVDFPLRLFINKDGSYKDTGDKINIVWRGRRLVLTCAHQPTKCDEIPIATFREAVDKSVRVSLNRGFINIYDVTFAKILAASAEEWISSE